MQVLADAILADVVVEPARPQSDFVLRVLFDARRGQQSGIGHASEEAEDTETCVATETQRHRDSSPRENLTLCLGVSVANVRYVRESCFSAARSRSSNFCSLPDTNSGSSTLSIVWRW